MIPRETLGSSLELVVPWLDGELVGPTALERIRSAASLLPPVHRAGFECRLAPTDDQVDLQQGIRFQDNEVAWLADYLRRAGALFHPGWTAVKRLAEAWQEPQSSLGVGLRELWLEVDLPRTADRSPFDAPPSVFAKLHIGSARSSADLARHVISLLTEGTRQEAALAAITICEAGCRGAANVSHVGVMLGRPEAGCRVHVSGLGIDQILPFMVEIGWPGDQNWAQRMTEDLLEIVDEIILCLDVGKRIGPNLGLECVFRGPNQLDPRLHALLDFLATRGLCHPPKCEPLLRWPGTITPASTSLPWPDSLVVLGLAQPVRRFGSMERRWSHVKVSHALANTSAKAYFGYEHVWSTVPGTA